MRTPPNERLSSDIAEGQKARTGKSAPDRSCPERRCILSGEHGPRERFVRLAISPEGLVLPDPLAKAPGRGAWLGCDRATLEEAMASRKLRGALARAFKGADLTVSDTLPEQVETALVRTLLDRLGLEMRAGHLLLGSDRIAQAARMGGVDLLLHASDASEDGSRKLDQAWRVGRDREGTGEQGIRLPLDRAALSVALGRDNVVHLALADGSAAGRVEAALTRLLHFQGLASPESDAGMDAHEDDGALPDAAAQDELNA